MRSKTNWDVKTIKMKKKDEEILSLNEAAKFLCASKSFMYKMTSQKIIPHYIPGGKRIFFKKSDLEDWLLKNRIPPSSEFETNTECYLSNPLKTKSND